MKSRRSFSVLLFLPMFIGLLPFLMLPSPVGSQDFPTKPITLDCGYAAGASTDVTARALADSAEKMGAKKSN